MVNGEIGWKDAPHKFKADSKDLFLKLQDGKNMVRFITNPFIFYIHEYQPVGAKYASKVRCSKVAETDPCPFCDEIVKSDPKSKIAPKTARRKERYYAGVLDRRSNSIKVLEFNSMIYDTIDTTSDDEDWGPPSGYDFNIKKDSKSPSPMLYYTATPSPKKPLTADEQEMVDAFDKQVIINLAKVPSVDKVMNRIAQVKEYAANDKSKEKDGQPEAQERPSQRESSKETESSSSDDGETFPEYSGQ